MEDICDECLTCQQLEREFHEYSYSTYCSFRVVELDASSQATLSKLAKLGDDELVELWKMLLVGVSTWDRASWARTSLGHNCIAGICVLPQKLYNYYI